MSFGIEIVIFVFFFGIIVFWGFGNVVVILLVDEVSLGIVGIELVWIDEVCFKVYLFGGFLGR